VFQVRTASCGALGCANSFGDEQLAVDVLADKLLFEALKFSVSFLISSTKSGHPQLLPGNLVEGSQGYITLP
jgi:hypothetical protein